VTIDKRVKKCNDEYIGDYIIKIKKHPERKLRGYHYICEHSLEMKNTNGRWSVAAAI